MGDVKAWRGGLYGGDGVEVGWGLEERARVVLVRRW